jgi:hypothetical protein
LRTSVLRIPSYFCSAHFDQYQQTQSVRSCRNLSTCHHYRYSHEQNLPNYSYRFVHTSQETHSPLRSQQVNTIHRFVRTSQETHYLSAKSPKVKAIYRIVLTSQETLFLRYKPNALMQSIGLAVTHRKLLRYEPNRLMLYVCLSVPHRKHMDLFHIISSASERRTPQ